ncbi:AAC(3) family N-acetyltransferase [Candidatus Poribacteria bacterium]
MSSKADGGDRAYVTQRDIEDGLKRVGLRSGDCVLVHSSLSRFGYVEGGVATVIDALLHVIGPDGTLIMSAITTGSEFVIECIRASNEGRIADVQPFDPDNMKTWAGKIPESFRNRPGVIRSLHPTHSVSAYGKLAEEMCSGHEDAPGPCGKHTPYMRLAEIDRGFILLLGVNHQSNTAIHGIEEIANLEYALYSGWCRIPIVTSTGMQEAHTRVHTPYLGRNLNALETAYIDGRAQTVTVIGNSCIRLINAKRMTEISLDALKKNPWLFITTEGKRTYEWMKQHNDFTRKPTQ